MPLQLSIFDIAGHQLYTKEYTATKGDNYLPIDASSLDKGLYILKLSSQNQVFTTLKFTK